MQEWFTLPGLFIVYGSITLIGTLYLYACMPETENKTLQDIEQFFIGDLDDYEDHDNQNWLIANKPKRQNIPNLFFAKINIVHYNLY